MITFLKHFIADQSGASAAEYGLLLVIIGIAIAAGGMTLASSIGKAMSDAASCIETAAAPACD